MNEDQNRDKTLASKALLLVKSAQEFGTPLIMTIPKQCPALRAVSVDRWNFFVGIAMVFMALLRLRSMNLSEEQISKVSSIVSTQLQVWDPKSTETLKDCQEYYDREIQKPHDERSGTSSDPRFVMADVIGDWIFLNVLHRVAEGNELVYASIVGMFANETFSTWWTGKGQQPDVSRHTDTPP